MKSNSLILLSGLSAFPFLLSAQDNPWSATLSAGLESRHIYRGVDSGMDGAIVWQSTAVTASDLTLGYWYGTGPNTDYEEFDLFGSYVIELGEWELIPGFLWYHFPASPSIDSTDLTLTLQRPITLGSGTTLTPFGYLSYNIDAEGTYGALGLRYSQDLGERWTFSVQALGAVSTDLRPENGWDHFEAGVHLTYRLNERATIDGFMQHSLAGEAIESISPDETWGGVTLNVAF